MKQIFNRFRALQTIALLSSIVLCVVLGAAAAPSSPLFSGTMRDANGTAYKVAIAAADQKITVESGGGWYQAGQKSASGHFRATLLAPGQKLAVRQLVALTAQPVADFPLGRAIYILRGKGHQPDFLVVEQYEDGVTVMGRVFVVRKGKMVTVPFRRGKNNTVIDKAWGFEGLSIDKNGYLHSKLYDRDDSMMFLRSTWKYNSRKPALEETKLAKTQS